MPSDLFTFGEKVSRTLSVCNCCGAFGHSVDKIVENRKKAYQNYINIIAGEFENISNDKYKVTTIQTKNGPVTIGYRHAW